FFFFKQKTAYEIIAVKKFPRYGRIEGRFMGLGRPADPEHIGDTFLWMKRSDKGPNTFSQTIKHLQPGRLYSMKMFSCDYDDLMNRIKKQRKWKKPTSLWERSKLKVSMWMGKGHSPKCIPPARSRRYLSG